MTWLSALTLLRLCYAEKYERDELELMSEPPGDSEVRLAEQCRVMLSGGHTSSSPLRRLRKCCVDAAGRAPVLLKPEKAGTWHRCPCSQRLSTCHRVASWALLQHPISLLAQLPDVLPECWVLGHLPDTSTPPLWE